MLLGRSNLHRALFLRRLSELSGKGRLWRNGGKFAHSANTQLTTEALHRKINLQQLQVAETGIKEQLCERISAGKSEKDSENAFKAGPGELGQEKQEKQRIKDTLADEKANDDSAPAEGVDQ